MSENIEPTEESLKHAERFLADHFHSEAVLENVHRALALEFTTLERKLEEARKYLSHTSKCDKSAVGNWWGNCTCGLAAFLSTLEGAEGRKEKSL